MFQAAETASAKALRWDCVGWALGGLLGLEQLCIGEKEGGKAQVSGATSASLATQEPALGTTQLWVPGFHFISSPPQTPGLNAASVTPGGFR